MTTKPTPPPPLIVRQVANGYIVEDQPGFSMAAIPEQSRVFQSFGELHAFLAGYFTHRSAHLASDAVNSEKP